MKLLLVFAAVVVLCALVSAEKETKAKQHKKEERTAAKAHHGKSAKSRAAATAHAEKSKREHAPHGVKKSERKHDSKQKKANRSKGAKKAVRGRANREGENECKKDNEVKICNSDDCEPLTCGNYDSYAYEWLNCVYTGQINIYGPTENVRDEEQSSSACVCGLGLVRNEESGECIRYSECPEIPTEETTTETISTSTTFSESPQPENGFAVKSPRHAGLRSQYTGKVIY